MYDNLIFDIILRSIPGKSYMIWFEIDEDERNPSHPKDCPRVWVDLALCLGDAARPSVLSRGGTEPSRLERECRFIVPPLFLHGP